MLEEHEVGLLAALGRVAVHEPLVVRQRVSVVVLAEGRVGDHAVESRQFATAHMRRVGERVVVAQVGVSDAMQQHVHLGDRPSGAVVLLPSEHEVVRITAVVDHMVAGVDQHAARARARVVDRHARLRIDEAHHELHHRTRCVELTALLAGRVGKVSDQVLVGGAEKVGELEVLIT